MPGSVSDSYEGPSDEKPEIPAWALEPLETTDMQRNETTAGKGFEAVTFPDQYPPADVAEHEVLMAFNGDSDAVLFREWWHAEGAMRFGKWREKQR